MLERMRAALRVIGEEIEALLTSGTIFFGLVRVWDTSNEPIIRLPKFNK